MKASEAGNIAYLLGINEEGETKYNIIRILGLDRSKNSYKIIDDFITRGLLIEKNEINKKVYIPNAINIIRTLRSSGGLNIFIKLIGHKEVYEVTIEKEIKLFRK